jgi:hypothetical protein
MPWAPLYAEAKHYDESLFFHLVERASPPCNLPSFPRKRESRWSSGLRPRITCGWLTHGRLLFFACAKKSNQKKHTPERATSLFVPGVRRSAAHPFGGREVHRTSLSTPPHPRPTGRSPTRRPHNTRLDSNRGSLENPRSGCGTRRALRGGEQPISNLGTGVLFHPVWRARASQPVPESSRAPCSSPSRVVGGWRVGARAGTGEKRREQSRHPGVLSLSDFSLHEQREVTHPRCGNRNYTRGRSPHDNHPSPRPSPL